MAKDPIRWANSVEIKLKNFPPSYEILIARMQAHYKTSVPLKDGALIAYVRHEYTNYDSLRVQVRKKWRSNRSPSRDKTKLEFLHLNQLEDDAVTHLRNRINRLLWQEIKQLKFQPQAGSRFQLQPSQLLQTSHSPAVAAVR